MTINEKLEIISELECEGFKQSVINSITESLENPENNKQFNSVADYWKYLDAQEGITK